MKIGVVGAGGVGGFLGGLLAHAGHEVVFLARGAHLSAMQERGLEVRSPQVGNFKVPAVASDDPARLGKQDLVVVGVKMYDFAQACPAVSQMLAAGGVALTTQNGLDAPSDLAKHIGPDRTLTGTMTIEATVLEPGVIGHLVPVHQLRVGALVGPPTERVHEIVGLFQQAGISAVAVPDGRQALWDKMGILVPFATLTTVNDSTLGDILGLPELEALFATLTDEVIAVARADGYDITQSVEQYRALVRKNAAAMAQFTSSMNRDFRAGKARNELEWITGRTVRLADDLGVGVPAHRSLYALLKLQAQRLGASS